MADYLTIDTGTTNTRISYVKDGKIIDTCKYKVGVGDVTNDPLILKETIKKGIKEILKCNNLCEDKIQCIMACGMITSELGLCNLPHLSVPCGIEELAKGLHNTMISDVCNIPFIFVRGVKSQGKTFETSDIMRGEETEILGFGGSVDSDCLYVLPGSHSKLIFTDKEGRISRFSTELTGELMSAVANGTILSQSIDLSCEVEVDEQYLKKGYLYAKEHGVNAAFFKVRILTNLFNCTKPQIYGFFKGAALCGEIENIIKSDAKRIVVGGKSQLKNIICYLLKEFSKSEIITVPDNVSDNATTYGMIKIYEYSKRVI